MRDAAIAIGVHHPRTEFIVEFALGERERGGAGGVGQIELLGSWPLFPAEAGFRNR